MPAMKLPALVLLWLLPALPGLAANLQVVLKADGGQLLSAAGGGGGELHAQAHAAGPFERFTLVDLNGGDLRHGDTVALRTASGHYLGVQPNHPERQLDARRASVGPDERFELHRLDSSGAVVDGVLQAGDRLALSTGAGGGRRYVAAEGGGAGPLNANRPAAAAWERFVVAELGPPPRLRLSAPFRDPGAYGAPIGVDHAPAKASTCTDFRGRKAPRCYRFHRGNDFPLRGGAPAQDRGQDVLAAAAGVVVKVVNGFRDDCTVDLARRPAGPDCPNDQANHVVLRQDDGLLAYYFHLRRDSLRVAEQDHVACGQVLGQAGSSGGSVLPHLHFELLPPLDAAQEQQTGFDLFKARDRVASVDPYAEQLWAELSVNEVPRRTCNLNNATPVAMCRHDVDELVCADSRHRPVCLAVPRGQHHRVCLAWQRPGQCRINCAQACRVERRSFNLPCPPR